MRYLVGRRLIRDVDSMIRTCTTPPEGTWNNLSVLDAIASFDIYLMNLDFPKIILSKELRYIGNLAAFWRIGVLRMQQ